MVYEEDRGHIYMILSTENMQQSYQEVLHHLQRSWKASSPIFALSVPVNAFSSCCCSCCFFFLTSLLKRASAEEETRKRTRTPKSKATGLRKDAGRLMMRFYLPKRAQITKGHE